MRITLKFLIAFVQLGCATSDTFSIWEEEFIADYLDAFDNLHPTFLVRTDIPGFAEFGLTTNKTMYSSIYYDKNDIEALAEWIASLVFQMDDLNNHIAMFFIGMGHGDLIQVVLLLIKKNYHLQGTTKILWPGLVNMR